MHLSAIVIILFFSLKQIVIKRVRLLIKKWCKVFELLSLDDSIYVFLYVPVREVRMDRTELNRTVPYRTVRYLIWFFVHTVISSFLCILYLVSINVPDLFWSHSASHRWPIPSHCCENATDVVFDRALVYVYTGYKYVKLSTMAIVKNIRFIFWKTQYVLILTQNSSHTVFFSPYWMRWLSREESFF